MLNAALDYVAQQANTFQFQFMLTSVRPFPHSFISRGFNRALCSHRPEAVWGEHPGPDAGLCVGPPLQAQALAQAQPEGPRALRTHAAVAQRPPQCGQAAGHEEDGEERYSCANSVHVPSQS